MPISTPIEFSVTYRLREYLDFVTEHSFDTEEALRSTRGLKRHLIKMAQRAIATIGFFYKMSRVGPCHFVIDVAGLNRRSKNGEGSVPWSRVKAVHTYTRGFLVELESGAMPIPFRVLSDQQRESFCALAHDVMLSGGDKTVTLNLNPLRNSA